jgi:hypothetical protein
MAKDCRGGTRFVGGAAGVLAPMPAASAATEQKACDYGRRGNHDVFKQSPASALPSGGLYSIMADPLSVRHCRRKAESMRLVLALRAFFLVLFSRDVARRVAAALEGEASPEAEASKAEAPPSKKKPAAPPRPARSEALTLLAALQREARFLDIVREPLAQYSDAQIGAASRDVLRDCGAVVERMFGPQAVVAEQEGATIELPEHFDAGCYRLTGAVGGQTPTKGQLVHHGWKATRCELPTWSGSEQAAQVIAPAEVEVK